MKVGDKVVVDNYDEMKDDTGLHDGDNSPLSLNHVGKITEIETDCEYGKIYEVDGTWWFYKGNLKRPMIVPNSLFSL